MKKLKKEYDPMKDFSRETGLNPIIEEGPLAQQVRAVLHIHGLQRLKHCYNENFNYYHNLVRENGNRIQEYEHTLGIMGDKIASVEKEVEVLIDRCIEYDTSLGTNTVHYLGGLN